MARLIKNIVLVAICLVLVVPAALMATGVARFQVFVVNTGSMLPTIQPNSAVIVEEGVYRVGQMISFRTANGVVTHRLIERRSDGSLVTKGDANTTVDPGFVSPASVIGGVIAAAPFLGYPLVYLKSPLGIASVFLAMLCVWLVSSVVAQRRGQRQAQA